MTMHEQTGDDAELIVDAADGHIDLSLASAYEQTFRVRYSRTEFALLLWRCWVVLIRSL